MTSETIWVTIASVFIAFCALGVTIWQGRQNSKHNKLSVRPLLSTMEVHDKGNISFVLVSCGLGPAIIKKFILLNGSKEISGDNRKAFENFLAKKMKDYTDCYVGFLVPGHPISVNSKHILLSFHYDAHNQDISFIHDLNLVIEYQSIYEDKIFTYDSRNDRKFHGR